MKNLRKFSLTASFIVNKQRKNTGIIIIYDQYPDFGDETFHLLSPILANVNSK